MAAQESAGGAGHGKARTLLRFRPFFPCPGKNSFSASYSETPKRIRCPSSSSELMVGRWRSCWDVRWTQPGGHMRRTYEEDRTVLIPPLPSPVRTPRPWLAEPTHLPCIYSAVGQSALRSYRCIQTAVLAPGTLCRVLSAVRAAVPADAYVPARRPAPTSGPSPCWVQ